MEPGDRRRLLVIRACCAGAAAIAVAVLVAWTAFGPDRLDQPWIFVMKANTAASIAVLAWALALSSEGPGPRSAVASAAASLLVGAVAVGTLVSYALGVSLGLGELLLPDPQAVWPGRMAPATAAALGFLSLGVAVRRRPGRASAVAVDVAWVASGIVLEIVVSGYAYQLTALVGPSEQTRTSPQTVVALVLLWVAFVASRFGTGLLRIPAGTGAGSLLARWLLVPALVVPTALVVVRLSGEFAGWYERREGLALFGVADSVLAIALIFVLAARLNREEARREQERRKREELERYLTICAWTQRVRWKDEWVPVERYLAERFGIEITHGMSEEALERLLAEQDEPDERPAP